MITLYGGGPMFGLPETSPYVTKTEVQLKMAGIAFTKATAMPDQGPKGQVPFIEDAGAVIGDSTFIREHVEAAYDVDLDAGLTERQRAEAWAVERMLENHLSWASCHFRWIDQENFERGPARFFDGAPEGVKEGVLERVKATMHAVGMGRHTEAEILRLGERSLSALSAILGDKPYLFGTRPCGADATAFALLAGILTPFFPSALRDAALGHANLAAYVDRMMARYYPDFAWTPAADLARAA
jgi:glutathione S-transferase